MQENEIKIVPVFDRKKKAGVCKAGKIELLVYFGRTDKFYVSAGVQDILASQWDAENRVVVSHKDARAINKKLSGNIDKLKDFSWDILRRGGELTSASLRAEIKRIKSCRNMSFYDFAIEVMRTRKLRESSIRVQKLAFDALAKSKCVQGIQDLTPRNIAKFDSWLRNKNPNMVQTTIHNYHKRLKPYINEAVRQGLLDESPYEHFKVKRGKHQVKIPLMQDELDKIRELELMDRGLERSRDIFIFCCYTGLAYSDVNAFDYERDTVEINGKRFIDAKRVKTGTMFHTPLLPPALEVLRKYNYRLSVYCLQVYNRHLKMLQHIAGIRTHISSHIARHTFATTVLLANDVPLDIVCRMLGHTDVNVTKIYAKVLNTTVDRHSEKLFEMLS